MKNLSVLFLLGLCITLPSCSMKEQLVSLAESLNQLSRSKDFSMKKELEPLSDDKRVSTYHTISKKLASLNDTALIKLLGKEESEHVGIGGGHVGSFEIDGTKIFFKKINLTDLEKRPENKMSTKNVFDLPLYYQYGVGSAGFGAWRELQCHIMATNWVITGACPNFPILYHWRVLPRKVMPPTAEELERLEKSVKRWNGSPAVCARLEAIQKSSASIVLFLEYIPDNLDVWLQNQFAKGDPAAKLAVEMIERDLKTTIDFMKSHDLVHFDAHFGNILTDGHRLYFTDFGLALCSCFELSTQELQFFTTHRNYDYYLSAEGLVVAILSYFFKATESQNAYEIHRAILQEYAAGTGKSIKSPWIAEIITRYAPTALIMFDFMHQLHKNKSAPFPALEFEKAYEGCAKK